MPLTGTFCLTCDTPTSPAAAPASGLSVADAHHVRRGRPIQAIGIGVALVVALGFFGWGIYQASRPQDSKQATQAVTQGLTLLVRAESGVHGPCTQLAGYLHGTRPDYEPECRALIGTDPGAHLEHLKIDRVTLHHGGTGTAQVHATFVDDQGSHSYDRQVDLRDDDTWRFAWDGRPVR